MSVRKTCYNRKHYSHGACVRDGYLMCGEEMKYWELSDDAKADLLHDAETEHDIPKYKSCKLYINRSCDNAKIFADKPGVKLDCSKCKSYIRGYYKLPTNTPTNTPTNIPTEPEHDAVNHPSHYTAGGIECIEALKAATTRLTGIEAVCTANAIKYLWRWKDKNGTEDIRKAIWYCERLLKEIENKKT